MDKPKRGRPPIAYPTLPAGHAFAGMQQHGYPCVSADPAWTHKQFSMKGYSRHPSNHYPTMSIEQIKALPVGDVASKHAWLFLWTTWPHLPQALDVITAWGFAYSSCFLTWVKLTPRSGDEMFLTLKNFHYGTGYTSRKNTEILLLGRRGRPEILVKPAELMIAARREHSRKPDETFRRIEGFCPGPRLELFSREPRDGWMTWGNQTDHFADPAPYSPIKLSMEPGISPDIDMDNADLEIPAFLRRLAQ